MSAKAHKSCIFASTAARAAEEAAALGKKRVTPYWRTLKAGGEINDKYPGWTGAQTVLLKKEGHTILQKGKRCFVADFEKCLVK